MALRLSALSVFQAGVVDAHELCVNRRAMGVTSIRKCDAGPVYGTNVKSERLKNAPNSHCASLGSESPMRRSSRMQSSQLTVTKLVEITRE